LQVRPHTRFAQLHESIVSGVEISDIVAELSPALFREAVGVKKHDVDDENLVKAVGAVLAKGDEPPVFLCRIMLNLVRILTAP
jgi:hypothetical protein